MVRAGLAGAGAEVGSWLQRRPDSDLQAASLLEAPQVARAVKEREHGHLVLRDRIDKPIAPDHNLPDVRGVEFGDHSTAFAEAI